jgi:hyaluronate lyase
MWLDHGVDPSAATYSYLVAPGASAARTKQLAQYAGLLILRNTADVQALLIGELLMANFWKADRIAELTADTPCSVIRRVRGREIDIAVSDPTQLATSVRLRMFLPGAKVVRADEGVTAVRTLLGLTISADVTGAAGASKTLTIRI